MARLPYQSSSSSYGEGWVKLPRWLLNEGLFADEHLWQLYCWLLLRARHRPGSVAVKLGKGKRQVRLKVGDVIVGRDSLGNALGSSPTTVWKRLLRLQRLGYVQLRSEQQVTIVSIVPPLGESPSKEQPSPTQGPPKCRAKDGQGTQIKNEDTDQKDKRNERGRGRSSNNNDEQDRYGDDVIPSLEQIVSQIRSYIVDIARSSDSRFDDRIAQVAILRQRMEEIKQQNEARLAKGEMTKESRQWYEGLRQFNELGQESDNLRTRNNNLCEECGLSIEAQKNLAREFRNWIIGPKGRAILRDSDWRSEVNKWTQREISTRQKRREMRSRSG